MENKKIEILECTLRDGSYVIDFQFSVKDTMLIGAALENAGFNLIEIGHGVGLNSSNAGKGVAAATDEEYMQAAVKTFKRAKWGMFFIPGIARHEDLELAARYGMHFVRVGTNANEVEQSKDYVAHAKKLDMFVSANLMKSYVLPPAELAEKAKLSQDYGVDLVCLVDSAGTMMPEDVRAYLTAMRDRGVTAPLGLHCHDNLALGMANVLTAIDCGATRIDSTLQGMGRGGGNPVTEVLLTVLKKRGIDLGIDLNRLMDISDRVIKPMLKDKGWDSINITSGYAGFHSSYLKTIMKYAQQYHVDPRDLIVGVCEADQVYAPDELVEEIAKRLSAAKAGKAGWQYVTMPKNVFAAPSKPDELKDFTVSVREITKEARSVAVKKGKISVLNIVAASQDSRVITVSPFIQEEFEFVICSMEVADPLRLKEVVEIADGVVDVFFVDSERKPYLKESLAVSIQSQVKKSRFLGYKDSNVWAKSVEQQMEAMLGGLHGAKIAVYGIDALATKTTLNLLDHGANITVTGAVDEALNTHIVALKNLVGDGNLIAAAAEPVEAVKDVRALLRFEKTAPLLSREVIEALPADAVVFDAGIGTIAADALAMAHSRNLKIIRPDMRAALAAELASLLGVQKTVDHIMGRAELGGAAVVAGGIVGRYGDVIVDSITNPTRVVGIADGTGHVIYQRKQEFEDAIAKVEEEIVKRQMA